MAHFCGKRSSTRCLRQNIKQRIYIQRGKNNGEHEWKWSTGTCRTMRVHRNAQRLIRLRPRLLIPLFEICCSTVTSLTCRSIHNKNFKSKNSFQIPLRERLKLQCIPVIKVLISLYTWRFNKTGELIKLLKFIVPYWVTEIYRDTIQGTAFTKLIKYEDLTTHVSITTSFITLASVSSLLCVWNLENCM